jgi:hypothetical protein
MWAWVLGILGIGIGLYEIATRNAAPPAPVIPPAGNPNARYGAGLRNPWDLDTPLLMARAQYCNLQAGDFRDASRWSAENINPGLPLLSALTLMYSHAAYSTWPPSAQRVYCTYLVASPPPTVSPQKPIGWH